jgi:hypothetical protein
MIAIDELSRSWGRHGESPFIAGMAKKHKGQPIAVRMIVVEGFRKTELAQRADKFIHFDSFVVWDDIACSRGMAEPGIEQLSGRDWVTTTLSNAKPRHATHVPRGRQSISAQPARGVCRPYQRPIHPHRDAAASWPQVPGPHALTGSEVG